MWLATRGSTRLKTWNKLLRLRPSRLSLPGLLILWQPVQLPRWKEATLSVIPWGYEPLGWLSLRLREHRSCWVAIWRIVWDEASWRLIWVCRTRSISVRVLSLVIVVLVSNECRVAIAHRGGWDSEPSSAIEFLSIKDNTILSHSAHQKN